jgi:hypothetical protein
MDVIDDPGAVMLQTLQELLTYPWLPVPELAQRIDSFLSMYPEPAFTTAFRHPSRH